MAKVLTILSSSRAYEFAPDRIRLPVMALPNVGTAIQEAFQFQVAGMAVPPATFGPVSPTLPPRAIFQLGVLGGEDGPQRHIRELYSTARPCTPTRTWSTWSRWKRLWRPLAERGGGERRACERLQVSGHRRSARSSPPVFHIAL